GSSSTSSSSVSIRSGSARAATKSGVSGITLRSIAEILDGRDAGAREAFIRALYDAEAPMWEDIPYPTPTPHWHYDRFRQMFFESGQIIEDASIVAYDGRIVAGLTMTAKRQPLDGSTWIPGV